MRKWSEVKWRRRSPICEWHEWQCVGVAGWNRGEVTAVCDFHLCFGDAVSGQLHYGEVTLPNCPFDIIETDPNRGFLSLCHHDHFQRHTESQKKSHDDHFTRALGSVSDTCEAGHQAGAWRRRWSTGDNRSSARTATTWPAQWVCEAGQERTAGPAAEGLPAPAFDWTPPLTQTWRQTRAVRQCVGGERALRGRMASAWLGRRKASSSSPRTGWFLAISHRVFISRLAERKNIFFHGIDMGTHNTPQDFQLTRLVLLNKLILKLIYSKIKKQLFIYICFF